MEKKLVEKIKLSKTMKTYHLGYLLNVDIFDNKTVFTPFKINTD